MIRPLAIEEHDAVRQIHERDGFDYPAPDLSDPLFVRKLAAETEKGIAGVLAARLTMEMYLFLGDGEPEERWTTFLELHDAMAEEMKKLGIAEVHAMLPPEIERRFGKRLESIGWVKEWQSYRFELDGKVVPCESIT
jgi:hypothetical protein